MLVNEAAKEMVSRLDWMTLEPKTALILGMGKEYIAEELNIRYENIQLIEDHNRAFLENQSIDLIIANFLLPWEQDMRGILKNWHQYLRQEGLLMFSMLGKDTLKDWQMRFQKKDLPSLVDMHEIGDLLMEEQFSDPVLDVDYLTFVYRDKMKWVHELKENKLLSSEALYDEDQLQPTETGTFRTVCEIIYAHAFISAEKNEVVSDHSVKISLAEMRRLVGATGGRPR